MLLRRGSQQRSLNVVCVAAVCRAPGERQRGHRRPTAAGRRSESSAARNPETKQELCPPSAAEVSVDFITQTSNKNRQPVFVEKQTNKKSRSLFFVVLLKKSVHR